ncbi:MAG: YegS/Rv2252/BmrU family lipid kinase [Acetobacteraceae bacterium]|nr:YegS/Rv2252/BmrU family lipid kinase [Pseudomonadota bacterium]
MMIVFNPVAGRRRAHLLWRVLDVLVAHGVRLDLAETRRPGHARDLAQEAARCGEPMVVAAGGDGTIAEVANGLLGSDTRLGVIPLGTANVLAHELALPFAPRAVAAALAFGRTRRLWPGQATIGEDKRMFVQMIGVGFDASVVHHVSPPLKRALGKSAYVVQSMREMARYRFPPIRVRIDDRETEAASVIVSKGRLYGGTFRLAQDTNPSEPGFTVVLFDRGGPLSTALYGAALPLHLLGHAPGVRQMRARQIDFLGNQAVPVQADGDPAGSLPRSITDAPAPIEIIAG